MINIITNNFFLVTMKQHSVKINRHFESPSFDINFALVNQMLSERIFTFFCVLPLSQTSDIHYKYRVGTYILIMKSHKLKIRV